jgi:hypothetical protein
MPTIVESAAAACELIDIKEKLSKAKHEDDNIAATLSEMAGVREKSAQLVRAWDLLKERLPLADISVTKIPALLQEVQNTHAKFTNEHMTRQVKFLQEISTKLQALLEEISQRWGRYAHGLIQDHVNLWAIVQVLPEMREQQVVVHELRDTLIRYASVYPQTSAELGDFDAKLEQMKMSLSAIESVHPEVKAFLRKVHMREATIADLTNEVLNWCRQEDRATVFQISLWQSEER